ncbi:PRC-barrel domain-containing protein [Candidatus Nomurabacteria bacterium]|nr:PRC-barrel domain-containing protein [Candidatus Nomurabacteria bacterium]
MRFSLKQLKKLDVETTSGTKLGHVTDLVFDVGAQSIIQYRVKGPLLSAKEFLVGRDQVAKFTDTAMVVYESVVKQGIAKEEKIVPEVQSTEPAITRQIGEVA